MPSDQVYNLQPTEALASHQGWLFDPVSPKFPRLELLMILQHKTSNSADPNPNLEKKILTHHFKNSAPYRLSST